MKQIEYEWDIEEINEDGDVENHQHIASLGKCRDLPRCEQDRMLVLVRDDWRDGSRSWAYVKDGRLPEYTEDAHGDRIAKVPARYHKELAAAM